MSGLGVTGTQAQPVDTAKQLTGLIASRFPWTNLQGRNGPGVSLRDDLELDSMHLVELQVAIEDHFCVQIDPNDERLLDAFVTLGSLDSYITHLIRRKTP